MLEDPKRDKPTLVGVASRERRAHPRYAFSAGAEIIEVRSGTRLNARISDLGRGGCYVDSISPFSVGAEVRIRITKDAHSFTSLATVVYATMGMGMGLMFTSIEPEQRWVLEKWLSELRGEPDAEIPAAEEAGRNGAPKQSDSGNGAHAEPAYVLNELIITLVRKRVLTDAEGKALLQKLLS